MTLEEAIKHITELMQDFKYKVSAAEYKALQLGIEALKRVKLEEPFASFYIGDPLPGETED